MLVVEVGDGLAQCPTDYGVGERRPPSRPSLHFGDMPNGLFDVIERKLLADLFDELGPDAPTLLEPWTTRDLAAHLVLREHDYLAAPGLVLPGAWGRFAERRRTALARQRLPLAGGNDPIRTATRFLPHRLGAALGQPQRVLCPPRGRAQSQRSWSSDELAREGCGALAQRQSRTMVPRSATTRRRARAPVGWDGPHRKSPARETHGSHRRDFRASCCSICSVVSSAARVEISGPPDAVKPSGVPGSACKGGGPYSRWLSQVARHRAVQAERLPAPIDHRPICGGKASTVSLVAIDGSVALAAREGVVVSREERSHEGSEPSRDPASSANEAVECATVVAEAWTFLDGECTRRHPCLGVPAPPGLRGLSVPLRTRRADQEPDHDQVRRRHGPAAVEAASITCSFVSELARRYDGHRRAAVKRY